MILVGDNMVTLKGLADNSVDSVVTDPPYGLSFMGKKWDYQVPSVELWREVFRVLKPGGHVLSFGGTRTYHRMVVNIEDAGFEIRDQIMWIYGSGFPKSHDVSKGIDARILYGASNPRSVKKAIADRPGEGRATGSLPNNGVMSEERVSNGTNDNAATPEGKKWQGWGTALKPANEPIVLARKPLVGTVAANVEQYGTGGLNIDASRIEGRERTDYGLENATRNNSNTYGADGTSANFDSSKGRWPANVLFDEEAAAVLDAQSGTLKSGALNQANIKADNKKYGQHDAYTNPKTFAPDSGGASRFFYVAKASKRERGEGNVHPTVKPIKLMEYLVKLVTPPNGTVLDPFTGSGTTGVACKNLGFEFIGCELDSNYVEIATKRIEAACDKP